jgi:hypothetical protein
MADGPNDDSTAQPAVRQPGIRLIPALIAVFLLIAAGYGLARYFDHREQQEVATSDLNAIVVTLRENRDRLQVQHLEGSVTTIANTLGGWGDILRGEMKVKQPWSVDYTVDMGDLTLDDYIWDEATRTLIVRAPPVHPEKANVDETRQIVAYNGPLITRGMQTRLRSQIATGAQKQATAEAAKPEHMAAASRAARDAIAKNIETPLRAAGIRDISVVVRMPADGQGTSSEHWDVSRSIAEVLAERAGR